MCSPSFWSCRHGRLVVAGSPWLGSAAALGADFLRQGAEGGPCWRRPQVAQGCPARRKPGSGVLPQAESPPPARDFPRGRGSANTSV